MLVTITAAGDILPLQVIFAGTTHKCYPKDGSAGRVEAESLGFHITSSLNHWSNMTTMMEWARLVLIPDVQRKRAAINKPNQWALIALDLWAVHKNKDFIEELRKNMIKVVFIPGGLTGE